MRSGQLGSVPAPAASQAREFNPGHAPHHRGIGVTPPGLGRENPGGFWGPVCAAGRGCSPLRPTQGASGGRGGNASGSFRRAAPAPSRGVGGLELANRHCAGMARMPQACRGARCLRTGKEQAPGPFPGARPDRSIGGFPVLSRRPVLAQMRRSGGAAVMAIGAGSPARIPGRGLDPGGSPACGVGPSRAERGRGIVARGGVSQERAALTIATMPAFRASGKLGQTVTTRPGSPS